MENEKTPNLLNKEDFFHESVNTWRPLRNLTPEEEANKKLAESSRKRYNDLMKRLEEQGE